MGSDFQNRSHLRSALRFVLKGSRTWRAASRLKAIQSRGKREGGRSIARMMTEKSEADLEIQSR